MRPHRTQCIGLCIIGALGMACSGTPSQKGSDQGLGWQTSVGGGNAGGDTSGTVGGSGAAGGAGDVGGTTSTDISTSAGGAVNAGGTVGTGGLDAGNAGHAGLLDGAVEYQGDAPQPGEVAYTDTDGQTVSVLAIPGFVVVLVSPTVTRSEATAMLNTLGAEIRASIPKLGYYLAGTTPGSEGQLILALRKDARTRLASPDIAIGPESVPVLHALDPSCPTPPTQASSCLDDIKHLDETKHGLYVNAVLNWYADGHATALCESVPSVIKAYSALDSSVSGNMGDFSAVAWGMSRILEGNVGPAFINLSWGPRKQDVEKFFKEQNKTYFKDEIDKMIVMSKRDLWWEIFSVMGATKQQAQFWPWDVVITVSAGNDGVNVFDAVEAVRRDPIAGGALAANGMIVGASVPTANTVDASLFDYDANFANDQPDFVKGNNAEAVCGTSLTAPYALARATNLVINGASAIDAVCRLKQAAKGNAQVLPETDPNASTCASLAVGVGAGETHSCAIHFGGTLSCWGFNAGGPLGNGNMLTVFSTSPASVVNIGNGFALSGGFAHTCGLMTDGTVWCWGDNEYGQLGNGGTSQYSYTPLKVWDSTGSKVIAAGGWHGCTALRDGSTWCWGKNDYGQLGNGTTINSPSPVAVASGAVNAKAIGGGGSHTCAVAYDSTVWCWGKNESGQLGDGTNTNNAAPVQVSGLVGAKDVTASCCSGKHEHSCALMWDGTVMCWGQNEAGELGAPSVKSDKLPASCSGDCSNKPVMANGITGAIAVTAGELHTCALLGDGTVWCWGDNMNGELGDNGNVSIDTREGVDVTTSDDNYQPAQVKGISGAIAIAARGFHTCAVIQDGTVWCWGMNEMGQLGNGTQTPSPAPVMVSGS